MFSYLARISFAALVLALFANPSSAQNGSGVFRKNVSLLPLGGGQGTLAFERDAVTFAPQSTGIENCVNVAINNTTDHSFLMTQLKSLDPRHFYVTSPSPEMMPVTLGANTTFYFNLCFKADKVRAYNSALLAIFQGDTIRLALSGRGLAPPFVMPIPKETAITSIRHKWHQWIFRIGLKTRGVVQLALENILGQVVRNFPIDALKTPGYYEVSFDGRSDVGKPLPKGHYILRLVVIDQQTRTKVHDSKLIKID